MKPTSLFNIPNRPLTALSFSFSSNTTNTIFTPQLTTKAQKPPKTMKWGRRKSPSDPSKDSKPSLFSSWLSKLKKMASTNDHDHRSSPVKPNVKKEDNDKDKDMVVLSVQVKELPEEEEKEIEIKTPRKGSVRELRFRSNHRRVLEDRLSKLNEVQSKHVLPMPSSALEQKLTNGQQKLKELKLKADRHRKSYYITPELQGRGRGGGARRSSKIRVYSPRTPTKSEICKIKALEGLKRAKKKKTVLLESLAVVKCSVDPERDFRESMVEMIQEEGIGKPEELEELLACYLTLNADEYHDLIIRVFRQVWLELNECCYV